MQVLSHLSRGRAITLALLALLAVAGAGAVSAIGAPAAPRSVIPNLYGGRFSTCFWNVGVVNGGTINIAYPDANANYWGAMYTLPAGATLKLTGQYPHDRYSSIQAYNALGVVQDALADYQINPNAGSTNPFRAGANRNATKRSFTLSLSATSPATAPNPDQTSGEPTRNVLNTTPSGDTSGIHYLIWRTYVPDKGRDLRGGVALPTPVLTLANGTILKGQALCNAVTSQVHRLPDISSLLVPAAQYNALRYQPGVPAWFPAQKTPVWRVQYNRAYLLALYTPGVTPPNVTKSGQAGFFPNLHNQYVRAALNRKLGKVVVLRGKLPTTPATYGGEKTMKGGTQMRYVSFCMTESVLTTKVTGCLYDEQVPLHAGRQYTIVISRAADRPRTATAKCGVAWLAWSPAGDGGTDHDFGWLQMRNMLPSPSFHHAIQNTVKPGDEKAVMGPYLPTATYYKDKAAVQKLGCPAK